MPNSYRKNVEILRSGWAVMMIMKSYHNCFWVAFFRRKRSIYCTGSAVSWYVRAIHSLNTVCILESSISLIVNLWCTHRSKKITKLKSRFYNNLRQMFCLPISLLSVKKMALMNKNILNWISSLSFSWCSRKNWQVPASTSSFRLYWTFWLQ